MGKAVFRQDTFWLTVTYAHVVNNSVKAAHLIQLLGHPLQIVQA